MSAEGQSWLAADEETTVPIGNLQPANVATIAVLLGYDVGGLEFFQGGTITP
jgi:hypothetical protein